jgi:hypothetical protein
MFERLTKYNDKHGNRLVPYTTCINCWWQEETRTSRQAEFDCWICWECPNTRWVVMQRTVYANNKVRSNRTYKVEFIGFIWVAGQSLTNDEGKNGSKCLPSSRNTAENMGAVLSHKTTKRILRLEDGSWHSAVDMMSLILIEFLDWSLSDSFGNLWTTNEKTCLPNLSNTV